MFFGGYLQNTLFKINFAMNWSKLFRNRLQKLNLIVFITLFFQ